MLLSHVQLFWHPMDGSTLGFPVLHYLGVCSNSCPLSWWYHLTVSFSVAPFSCPQSVPSSRPFPMSWLFTSGGQTIWASASVSILPIQGWFPLYLTDLFLPDVQGTLKHIFQHHSLKASILRYSPFFMVQLSHLYMTTGETIALTLQTFVDKVISLLLNMLSRLVITFLPRSKRLLISWLQSPSTVILEPKKIKLLIVFIVFPSICHKAMELDAMIFVSWMLSFKEAFSLSYFTLSRGSLVPLCFL